jgi:hypothetical protein
MLVVETPGAKTIEDRFFCLLDTENDMPSLMPRGESGAGSGLVALFHAAATFFDSVLNFDVGLSLVAIPSSRVRVFVKPREFISAGNEPRLKSRDRRRKDMYLLCASLSLLPLTEDG